MSGFVVGFLTLWVCVLELVLERLPLALGKGLHESESLRAGELFSIAGMSTLRGVAKTHVLATDSRDDIVRRRPEQLGDDRELVDVVLAGEQRLALQHLGEDAACTPDIHFHIILLPCEHDLRRPVVSRGDVAGHLRVLYTRQAEVADLEVAILVHEDVGGFEVAVDHAG